MDWILEHIQLIIVVAGSIAYWINQSKRAKEGQDADFDGDGIPENRPTAPRAEARELRPATRDGADPEQDERVRRIQEEIRRKIAERRGQPAPPPLAPPELSPFRPVFQEQAPPPSARPVEAPPVPVWREEPVREVTVSAYDDTAALERQRKLEEQLAQLEERRREARRAAQEASRSGGQAAANVAYDPAKPDVPGLSARRLQDELRSPGALRRAMVLKEVLGAPVALR
jgi:hypothetical protein